MWCAGFLRAGPEHGQDATVTIGHVVSGSFGMAFVIANSAPMSGALRAALLVAAVSVVILTIFSFGSYSWRVH